MWTLLLLLESVGQLELIKLGCNSFIPISLLIYGVLIFSSVYFLTPYSSCSSSQDIVCFVIQLCIFSHETILLIHVHICTVKRKMFFLSFVLLMVYHFMCISPYSELFYTSVDKFESLNKEQCFRKRDNTKQNTFVQNSPY